MLNPVMRAAQEHVARWAPEEVTYCSNVHPGESAVDIINNLRSAASVIRTQRGLSHMTVGLWLSAAAANALQQPLQRQLFQQTLANHGLQLASLNGFPYGGFHQSQVKSKVYTPDWSDSARLDYSKHLADVLADCLPEQVRHSCISTLPLGYQAFWSEQKQTMAEAHLAEMMLYLDAIAQRTGKRIILCLEMEPDCVLESTEELIQFFRTRVHGNMPHEDYLGVCFDVCHQAVMHEDVALSLQQILAADIPIGKIQLSNALQADFTGVDQATGQPLETVLADFAEEKYLHQVKTQDQVGRLRSSADLSCALATQDLPKDQPWRIHFHVPIHTTHFCHDRLTTTAQSLQKVFQWLVQQATFKPLLEVETYSWRVLPKGLRPQNDAELLLGIGDELTWVTRQLQDHGLLR